MPKEEQEPIRLSTIKCKPSARVAYLHLPTVNAKWCALLCSIASLSISVEIPALPAASRAEDAAVAREWNCIVFPTHTMKYNLKWAVVKLHRLGYGPANLNGRHHVAARVDSVEPPAESSLESLPESLPESLSGDLRQGL